MKKTILLLLIPITIIAQTFAQNIKSDKIKELFVLLHTDSLTIKMLNNMQNSYSTNYLKNLNSSDYLNQITSLIKDTSEINQIKSMMKDTAVMSMMKSNVEKYFGNNAIELSFEKIKEISIKFMNEEMVSLYDKYYTINEIEDLINFYKTKTGQKIITTMPELQLEIINLMQSKFQAIFIDKH